VRLSLCSDAMQQDLIELTSRLVAIDSVNPSLVPGGAGEAEIAGFVAGWAREAGLEAELLSGTPGRPSVVVRARGTGGGRTLMLCAHMDTVSVEGMTDPFEPRVEGDRLWGRGAYDMKAGLAAALVACREAARRGLAGDVVVAAVADEEHASLGVQEVLESVSADFAVVTEPTELEVVVAHKGFVWAEIEVQGRAAHGSRHWLGEDAIVKMGPILTRLGELDVSLGEREHELLGRGSVHASVISGGAELSSYPARSVLGLERRTLPGDTAADVERELESLLDACRRADHDLRAEQRTLLVRAPFEVDRNSQIVEVVRTAAMDVLGSPPPIGGASYWADAAFISAAGIPTVMFGPGGEGAHAVEEWVSVSDTVAVTQTLVKAAAQLCS
jgi:acetylornithine deacetylase